MNPTDPARLREGIEVAEYVNLDGPLPWKQGGSDGTRLYSSKGDLVAEFEATDEASYAVHAANDYPALARVVLALRELLAAQAENQRVDHSPISEVIAERELPRPRGGDVEAWASFGEEVYRPYRERLRAARVELEAALAAGSETEEGRR